jgi:hypothetical protein
MRRKRRCGWGEEELRRIKPASPGGGDFDWRGEERSGACGRGTVECGECICAHG